jgi:hypothetical protein
VANLYFRPPTRDLQTLLYTTLGKTEFCPFGTGTLFSKTVVCEQGMSSLAWEPEIKAFLFSKNILVYNFSIQPMLMSIEKEMTCESDTPEFPQTSNPWNFRTRHLKRLAAT